jgi:photosystem II stability/assembly factor-like uncharacterized protein
MKTLLSLFSLVLLSVNSFSQCDSSYLRPTGTPVNDMSLITENVIIGVGANGYIIKSTDGGKSWRNIPNNYGKGILRSIQFVNDSIGYVTGDSSILKTEDQGENWYPLSFPVDPHFGTAYKNLFFFNENRGFFVGTYGHLLSTNDGGKTVNDTTLGSNHLTSIDFTDDSTGLIAGSEIYKTTNGGRSWRKINIDNLGLWPNAPTFDKIKFITDSFVVAGGSPGMFAISSDGGETWTASSLNGNIFKVTDFYFFDANNGVIAGDGKIFYTHDGGKTFSFDVNYPQPIDVTTYSSLNADPSGEKLFASGGFIGREIMSTANKGSTWAAESVNGVTGYYDTDFINDSTGYISGENASVFKTMDYGETWQQLTNPHSLHANPVSIIDFTDSLHGFAVTEQMSYTSDGGKSWTQRAMPPDSGIYYMVFTDSLNGIASFGENIYRTTDGAQSWQLCPQPPGGIPVTYCNGIATTPSGKIFTCSMDGYVLQSGDSGRSWTGIYLNNENFTGIYFYNDSIGFIGTSDSVIYKTTNGGVVWKRIVTRLRGANLRSFAFSDSLHGFMLGNNGRSGTSIIYQTKDGGNTWTGALSEGEPIFKLAGYIHTYATGGGGLILKTDHLAKPSIPGYIDGPLSVCANSLSVYTTPQGSGLKYIWTTISPATQKSVNNVDSVAWDNAGQYTIKVTAQNACGTGPERQQIINVTEFKPVITVSDTMLTVTRGLNYNWFLNDTLVKSGTADSDRILIPQKNGIYKAEVLGVNGCDGVTDTVQYSLPLPFRLVSFSGKPSSDKTVDLNWVVANERNHLYEVIERGNDSLHFLPIDSIKAKNSNIAGDAYHFTDNDAGHGLNFYRLKFTSSNERINYSPVITVRGSLSDEPLLYPNPAKNNLGIYKGGEEILDVKIYNNRGVLVIEKLYSGGQANIQINISNLQNGLYYVKIKTKQNEYTEHLVVLR